MNAVKEVCTEIREYQNRRALADFDRRMALAKSNPLLALAYWIEAAGDHRIENDVCALSIMTDMRNRAREAIERHTGKPFVNQMYR